MKLYRIAIVFGITASATWFTVCDKFFHVNNNILVYYWKPLFQGQSLWAFPIFFCASAAFYLATSLFSTSWKEQPGYVSLVINAAVCTLVYFGSGLAGGSHPMLYFWTVLGVWVARIILLKEHRITALKACIIMGFLGCFWEGATSGLGYFDYHYVNVFNVPLWLFACYLHAGFLMLDLQSLISLIKRTGKLAT